MHLATRHSNKCICIYKLAYHIRLHNATIFRNNLTKIICLKALHFLCFSIMMHFHCFQTSANVSSTMYLLCLTTFAWLFSGTPRGIRIPDLLVRSQTLYPAELGAHVLCSNKSSSRSRRSHHCVKSSLSFASKALSYVNTTCLKMQAEFRYRKKREKFEELLAASFSAPYHAKRFKDNAHPLRGGVPIGHNETKLSYKKQNDFQKSRKSH